MSPPLGVVKKRSWKVVVIVYPNPILHAPFRLVLKVLKLGFAYSYFTFSSTDYFRTLFHVIFNDNDAWREKERAAYKHFLEDCEGT